MASTGSSSGTATQNAITGVFSSTSTSSSEQTVSESGDRGAAYTLAFTSQVDADQALSGNAITGAYASQSTSSSSSHSTRALADPAAGTFTVEETSDSEATESASGNSITAVSTSSSTLASSTVTLTSSANAAGTVRFSATATSTIDSESTAAVNAITGSLAQTTESTRTEQLSQSGVTTTAAFLYESDSTTTGTTETTGNLVTGQLTIETHNGVTTYTFTQDVDNTDGSGYTLAGAGQKTFDRTTTTNGQTGEYASTENGVDDYLLEQTHTAGGTTTTTVLDGEEAYTETETGNSETGEFTREASGSGDADRSVTVSDGATTTATQDVVHVQWVLSQAGNALDGRSEITVGGNPRYQWLKQWVETSAASLGVPGMLDFSPTGAPLFLTQGPAVPTGGGLPALSAAAVDQLFSELGSPSGSRADSLAGAMSPFGASGYGSAAGLSGADLESSFAELGGDDLHQYCFARGTRVLLASGATKCIEEVEPGDVVLAIPDAAPTSAPVAAVVERIYHNAPAELLNIHLGDDLIRSTLGHPFFVMGRGWVPAANLRIGDLLLSADGGAAPVTDLHHNGDIEPVYNLQVSAAHTYFIALPSGRAVLVHNVSPVLAVIVTTAVGALLGGIYGFATGFIDVVNNGGSWEEAFAVGFDRAAAGAISGGLIGAGVGILVFGGGFANPIGRTISFALIGAGIGGALQSGLVTGSGRIDWGGFGKGALTGAIIGGVAGASLFVAKFMYANPGAAVWMVNGGVMGGVNQYNILMHDNPDADIQTIFNTVSLGVIGGMGNPLGEFVGTGAGFAGGYVAQSMGYDWMEGYKVGHLMGNLVGGFAEPTAFMGCAKVIATSKMLGLTITKTSAIFASIDIAAAGIGAGVSYALGGDPMTGANIGMMAGNVGKFGYGLASGFTKSCFAAGTKLLTPYGYKRIEEFQPGDLVMSRDESDVFAPIGPQVVEEVFVREGRIIELVVRGRVIKTTNEHPFWVLGHGWLPAGELQAGDVLSTSDGGWVAVERVTDTGECATVYNLRVTEWHTYFVGDEGCAFDVWAHNATCVDDIQKAVGKNRLTDGEARYAAGLINKGEYVEANAYFRSKRINIDKKSMLALRARIGDPTLTVHPTPFVRPADSAVDTAAAAVGLSAKQSALAKKYLDAVYANEKIKWANIQPGLTADSPDAKAIRQFVRNSGLVPEISYTTGPKGASYAGFSGYALHTIEIKGSKLIVDGVEQSLASIGMSAKQFYRLKDPLQFSQLNSLIGGKVAGYTWHHHQDIGKFELVPMGLHQIYIHDGGRSPGHWAYVFGLR